MGYCSYWAHPRQSGDCETVIAESTPEGTPLVQPEGIGDETAAHSAHTKRDLTSDRVDELNRIDFQTLPFDRVVKIVRGDGSRRLAVFTDPDCPYCKMLEKELASVTNVTIYSFLFPLTAIHPKAEAKAQSIWCSPDRAAAWTHWMLDGKEPETKSCEGIPTAEIVELGKKLNVTGTPTMYFSTGRRQTGGMRAQDLTEALDKSLTESKASPSKPTEVVANPLESGSDVTRQ